MICIVIGLTVFLRFVVLYLYIFARFCCYFSCVFLITLTKKAIYK